MSMQNKPVIMLGKVYLEDIDPLLWETLVTEEPDGLVYQLGEAQTNPCIGFLLHHTMDCGGDETELIIRDGTDLAQLTRVVYNTMLKRGLAVQIDEVKLYLRGNVC